MEAALGELQDAVKAGFSRAWVERHRQAVKSGMQEARENGVRIGRPRKELSGEELALAKRLQDQGRGYRFIAHRISRDRGAFDVTDAKRRRELAVSHMTVYRALKRNRTGTVTKPPGA